MTTKTPLARFTGMSNDTEPSTSGGGEQNKKFGSATREELVIEYTPLVRYVTDRLRARLPAHVESEDLFNTGVLGLIDAVEKFIPDRGVKFRTYAEFRIRGAMLDYLRSQDWAPRSVRRREKEMTKAVKALEQRLGHPPTHEEIAKELGISIEQLRDLLNKARGLSLLSLNRAKSDENDEEEAELGEFIPDAPENGPSNILETDEIKSFLAKNIDSLPQREREVIELYYFKELTMREVGEQLGVTESRVSQLHSSAVIRLKGRISSEF